MQSLYLPASILAQSHLSNLETLTFGVKEIDSLTGGLRQGDLVVLHGSQLCHVISEQLCVRGQLSIVEDGLGSPVIFIDGRNLFDPYLISETARLLGIDPEEALRNIWVSRAFTCYQMAELITERLSRFLDQKDSRLVVISDIAALFCDSDILTREAKKTFNRVILSLWRLVKERNLMAVAYSLPSRSQRKQWLEQYLLGRADTIVGIEEGNPYAKVTLEKRSFKPSKSINLFFEEPSDQSRLRFSEEG